VKVCVVGAGHYARFHVSAWRRIAGVEIVGIADLNEAAARDAAIDMPHITTFTDVRLMVLNLKPDVLDIVTPEASHHALVSEFVGKVATIICQKPLAPSLDQARQMVELAESSTSTLLVHENFRFQPWFRAARQAIEGGVIGEPRQLTFRFRPGDGRGTEAYQERQPYFRHMARFLIHETAVHYIDVFRFLLGEVCAVTARLRRVNNSIAGEDAGIVVFEFESGAVAILDANRDLDHAASEPRYTQGTLLLEGANATLRLDGQARMWLRARGSAEEQIQQEFARLVPNGDSVFAFQLHVATSLQQGAVPDIRCHARAYLRNIEIEQAIYASDSEGRTICLRT